jgi:spore maturation protein CgeB
LEEYGVQYDVIIGYFYDSILTENTKKALKKYGKRLINYPLNLQDQPFLFSECLNFFDETWCAEETVVNLLVKENGRKIRYVPMASDPSLYRPLFSLTSLRAVFVGSAYGSRLLLLSDAASILPVVAGGIGYSKKSALKQAIKYFIKKKYTLGWKVFRDWFLSSKVNIYTGGFSDEGFVKIASECGISLGFNDVGMPNGEIGFKVRLREYESTMCGLCHIAQRLPELERHFVDREEILLYDNEKEFIEILRGIASGDLDWRSIGKAARAKSIIEHTWAKRLSLALELS